MSLVSTEQKIRMKFEEWKKKMQKHDQAIESYRRELLSKSMTASLQEVHRLKNLISEEQKLLGAATKWTNFWYGKFEEETGRHP